MLQCVKMRQDGSAIIIFVSGDVEMFLDVSWFVEKDQHVMKCIQICLFESRSVRCGEMWQCLVKSETL